jgi:hypothetical protein
MCSKDNWTKSVSQDHVTQKMGTALLWVLMQQSSSKLLTAFHDVLSNFRNQEFKTQGGINLLSRTFGKNHNTQHSNSENMCLSWFLSPSSQHAAQSSIKPMEEDSLQSYVGNRNVSLLVTKQSLFQQFVFEISGRILVTKPPSWQTC